MTRDGLKGTALLLSGAVAASSVTYIPPIVALLIGGLIVGEPLELNDYIATGLIFLGVFLLKRR